MFSKLFESSKLFFLNPVSRQWSIFLTIWFLMFVTLVTSHVLSGHIQEIDEELLRIQARLESVSSYDLDALANPSQRLAQLGKMSSSQNQPLKFVSEATTDSRRLKEIPYSMPTPVIISGSSLLHILDILHPSKESSPPVDLWVKYLKLRKDKDSFSLQMSLIVRELKP